MGSLKDMIGFLEKNTETMDNMQKKLEKLQEFFNGNYNNVTEVRNREIEFLQNEFFRNRSQFPAEIGELYDQGLKNQEKLFKENISALEKKREELKADLEKINRERLDFSAKFKRTNTNLDKREEAMKTEVEAIEKETAEFNAVIDELNTGFGFISNFLKMKKIQNQKDEILKKRDRLVEQIEVLRNKWKEAEQSLTEEDMKIQEKWNYLQTEYSIISEKIRTLEENRENLIRKGAFSEALAALHGNEKFLEARAGEKSPGKCRKCGSENRDNLFFCNFCGEPFSENRGDIAGSLVEIGELNRIYAALSEGVKESVSIIALARGLKDGLNAFLKSINDVYKTENTYSQLPKLKINIPEFSEDLSGKITEIEKQIDVIFFNLHPLDFAKKIKSDTDKILTGQNIEKFFSAMGDELNKTTKEQWK